MFPPNARTVRVIELLTQKRGQRSRLRVVSRVEASCFFTDSKTVSVHARFVGKRDELSVMVEHPAQKALIRIRGGAREQR